MQEKGTPDSFGTYLKTIGSYKSRTSKSRAKKKTRRDRNSEIVGVLKVLEASGPATFVEIAESAGLAMPELIDTLKSIREFDMVEVISSGDQKQLRITDTGRKMLNFEM